MKMIRNTRKKRTKKQNNNEMSKRKKMKEKEIKLKWRENFLTILKIPKIKK